MASDYEEDENEDDENDVDQACKNITIDLVQHSLSIQIPILDDSR